MGRKAGRKKKIYLKKREKRNPRWWYGYANPKHAHP
jgi:hypothetical protein